MRAFVSILLLLLALGWLGAGVPPSTTATSGPPTSWRRTVHGWERASWLAPPSPRGANFTHPAVLAYLEVGLSVLAFVLFPPSAVSRPAEEGNHRR